MENFTEFCVEKSIINKKQSPEIRMRAHVANYTGESWFDLRKCLTHTISKNTPFYKLNVAFRST